MTALLLIIIYIVFISLGLPDSAIGSAWPSISASLNFNPSYQGILTVLVSFFTILSSFLTAKWVKAFKEVGTVLISIALTVSGLLIFGYAPNIYILLLACIPLGMGAGAIDSTLNNYVALHYKAIHLNWLHAFWGVGATLTPMLLSHYLSDASGWRKGIILLVILQASIFLITLCSFPLWKKSGKVLVREQEEEEKIDLSFLDSFKIRGVIFSIIAFFSYICVEGIAGNWCSSMAVFGLGVDEQSATRWASYFYMGITAGRFISGVISLKIRDSLLIRISEAIIAIGLFVFFFSFMNPNVFPYGLVVIGLGCAPIFPAMIHITPKKFTAELSQNVMSVQIGCSYIGTMLIVPLFGVISEGITFNSLPYFLTFFLILMIVMNEFSERWTKDKNLLLNDRLKEKYHRGTQNA